MHALSRAASPPSACRMKWIGRRDVETLVPIPRGYVNLIFHSGNFRQYTMRHFSLDARSVSDAENHL